MDELRRAIRATRARLFRQAWLTATGGLTLVVIALFGALLAADRLLALQLPLGLLAALHLAVVVVFAPIIASHQKRTDGEVAALLDHRLDLNDRLATALYAESLGDDPLATQVRDEAQLAAQRAPVALATPIGMTKRWAYIPIAIVALVLAWWLLPGDLDLLGLQAKRNAAAKQIADQRAAERELEQAQQMMRRAADRAAGEKAEGDEASQLAQLTNKDLSTPEGRKQAAAELAEAADQLGDQAAQKQKQADEQDNMLSRLETNKFGPANRFASDLRRGDTQAAEQSLQDLSESIEGMSDEQKQDMAEQLSDIASQLDREAKQQDEKQKQAAQDIREQLAEQGLDNKQIDALEQKQFDKKAVQEALKENGAGDQQARDAAKEINDKNQQQQAAAENKKTGEQLSNSLKRMADATTAPSQGDATQQQSQPSTQQQQQQSQQQPSNQQASAQQPSNQQTSQQQSGQQSASSQQQQNQPQQGQSSQQPQQSPSQQPASNQQQTPSQQSASQQNSSQQQGSQSPSSSPSNAPSNQPGGSNPGNSFQQASQSTQQQLQRMSQTGQQAQSLKQSQQQMRQAMQRMSGNSPPNPSQGAGDGQGDGAGAPTPSRDFRAAKSQEVNDMSAERRRNAGKVIGSWDDGGEVPKGEAKVAFEQAAAAAMTEVEQSVNEDRVPKRYHEALREYFKQTSDK